MKLPKPTVDLAQIRADYHAAAAAAGGKAKEARQGRRRAGMRAPRAETRP